MIAFVLSGGGSLGATQAGMLEALLERDIVPDVLVGTSIGAANAAFLAADPTLAQGREQSRLFLSGQPCDTCDHDSSRLAAASLSEEVVRLQADLSVA